MRARGGEQDWPTTVALLVMFIRERYLGAAVGAFPFRASLKAPFQLHRVFLRLVSVSSDSS